MDEKVLVGQLKEGSEDAFRYIVDKYQLKVINTCHAYLHNRDEAEDIAQDVFMEVFKSIHSFRGEAGLSTWIYRIAINKSLNQQKRNKRNRIFTSLNPFVRSDDNEDGSGNIADINLENAETQLVNQEQKKVLFAAIDRLPENQRTAFLLRKYEDLSYKEIAEVMQTSVSSVESLLFRSKSNLKKALNKAYERNEI